MNKFGRYKFFVYLVFIFLISGIFLYSLKFLYDNFYSSISWSQEQDINSVQHIDKIKTEKLNKLVKKLDERKKLDPEKNDFFCLSEDCRVTTTEEVEGELTCRPELGAGGGADCNWQKGEIHDNPEGDPDLNFMVYEINPALRPLSLSMRWPSIMRCDAYEVFLSVDGEEWISLGGVPSNACPYEEKTVLASYELEGIDSKIKYLKIAKLYDNEGDDSVDTPVEIEIRGEARAKKGENKRINFCSP